MLQILTNGIKAGLIAGFLWGIMNILFVSPLILEAEKYEGGGEVVATTVVTKAVVETKAPIAAKAHDHNSHDHGTKAVVKSAPVVAAAPVAPAHGGHGAHEHGEGEFEPEGAMRPALSVLGTSLLGAAYGVLLSCILLLALKIKLIKMNFISNPWVQGALLGLSGFVILHGLPSIGLPPPLPGVANSEADFGVRQAWWLKDVFLNLFAMLTLWFGGSALSKLSFGKTTGTMISVILAIVLIWIPFGLIGVPEHATATAAPADLQSKFLVASLTVNFIFWVVLSFSTLKLNQKTLATSI